MKGKKIKNCAICGAQFLASQDKAKFCSPEHRKQGGRERNHRWFKNNKQRARELARASYYRKPRPPIINICSICSKPFTARAKKHTVCYELECQRTKRNENARNWRRDNREKAREMVRLSAAKRRREGKVTPVSPEKQRIYDRRSREKHPEKKRAMYRRWVKNNPEKARVNWSNNGARRRGAEGRHTDVDLARIWEAQEGKCANPYCRIPLTKETRNLDHIISLSKGGSNWPENLQYLCDPCNSRKYNTPPDVWLAEQKALHEGHT